jgi:HEAT repeat protein
VSFFLYRSGAARATGTPLRWLLLGLAIAIALPACRRNTDPTSVAYWADRASSPALRVEAMRQLGQLGKPEAAPVLLRYLKEPGPWQVEAAHSLALLDWADGKPELLASIDTAAHGDTPAGELQVRLNAASVRALADLHAGPEALDKVVRLLQNPEYASRHAAIETAGRLRFAAALPLLLQISQDHSQPSNVQAALQAIGSLRAQSAVPLLVKSLYFDAFAPAASFALLRVGPRCLPEVMQTLKHGNPGVEKLRDARGRPLPEGLVEQRAGAVAIQLHAGTSTESIAAAVDAMLERAANWRGPGPFPVSLSDSLVELIRGLGRLLPAGRPTLVRAVDGPAALQRACRRPKPSPELVAAIDRFADAAADALGMMGPSTSAQAALLGALPRATGVGRRHLLDALSQIGDANVMRLYPRLIGTADPSPADKRGIERLQAAAHCGSRADCWRQALSEPEEAKKERAAYALGWLGDKTSIGLLTALLGEASVPLVLAAVLSLHRLAFDAHGNLVDPYGHALSDGLDAALLTHNDKPSWKLVDTELQGLIQRIRTVRRDP